MRSSNTGNGATDLLTSIMHDDHFISVKQIRLVLLATYGFGTPAAAQDERVIFVGPVKTIASTSLPVMVARMVASLAAIDAGKPITDDTDTQTLSIFGREDLIANVSGDYKADRCFALTSSPDVLADIERRARKTSVVIINESHGRSQHRGFIAQVAKRLRPLSYDTLAIETLTNNPSTTPARYGPTFLKHPELRYFSDEDGHYLAEAGFGRLGRQAKALGYTLFSYEHIQNSSPKNMTREQQIATREEGQAVSLAAYIGSHPKAKLLVHVGYSHATEVPRADGNRWMATRLKAKTGINPLTISQTTCRGSGSATRLSALPKDEPPGTFDLVVDHPTARFERGRPAWRRLAGDMAVSIPAALRPTASWRIVEARPDGEPDTSVPMDRVAIRPGEDIALMLPPGRYNLRLIDPPPLPQEPASPAH